MTQANFNKQKIESGIASLKQVSKKSLCPNIFKKDSDNTWKRKPHTQLPFKGGVYVYWFKGKDEELQRFRASVLRNPLTLQGKANGKNSHYKVQINYTEELLDAATIDDAICLYVGKATFIPKRISNHIMPTKSGRLTGDISDNYGLYLTDDIPTKDTSKPQVENTKKPNTMSQLRIGLERLLPHIKDVRFIIMKHVHLSYYSLDGYEEAINRFFLEDLAIGTFCPLLNIDIER